MRRARFTIETEVEERGGGHCPVYHGTMGGPLPGAGSTVIDTSHPDVKSFEWVDERLEWCDVVRDADGVFWHYFLVGSHLGPFVSFGGNRAAFDKPKRPLRLVQRNGELVVPPKEL